ncbi:undecaprenyldiphospho-muramoylpentapeptide beta-N-acetylglucosaminyltransferase [Marinithermus hydrothermalis]|uniref:UDP-N-acetylglucosamine--N-acetylmuramyl-(pentapeptide) pyrophosphoryl-undecaprenol N-acetylglucosamine transferase n=1 Tax=Marinithermus hydrothermalis (strain DSM 14884 / JCM 11576 / T1) TaxID=869210 RepID=F2NML4_MARHT|nr:undecaprenyldiphospho-muramoylpentapeptide beta-N-acetylglucosaminyltransferase [Marinithermus hydrothermalis]AEB12184.1 UDP-N-acetylglucosamine--N-acetylmuramyl- (pentapeptide) pyrophosphoryl-undecaprenol N-acetylglucosamine transferase [Marinithermus hydrothermalis DSM 14884]
MRFVVTGGGTGGHIFPAIAVGARLAELGHEVHYVGSRTGLEARLVPKHGLRFHGLTAGKFDRTAFRPGEAFKVIRGLLEARSLLRELRPDAVLATGGYAAFPFAFVAARAGVPLVVHEQNARMGLANRWLAPHARRLALAMPIPSAPAKAEVVGLPVREVRHDPQEARHALGLEPDRPTLLVLGGSQGSKVLNEALPGLLEPYLETWQVLHQTGERWLEETQGRVRHPHYHLAGFVDTTLAWAAAEIAITRAGAMTLAEAAYHRVPLLLVPLPPEIDSGAQRANARLYQERGAARMLDQGNWERFHDALAPLLDPARRAEMRRALATLSPEGAADRTARLVLEVVR